MDTKLGRPTKDWGRHYQNQQQRSLFATKLQSIEEPHAAPQAAPYAKKTQYNNFLQRPLPEKTLSSSPFYTAASAIPVRHPKASKFLSAPQALSNEPSNRAIRPKPVSPARRYSKPLSTLLVFALVVLAVAVAKTMISSWPLGTTSKALTSPVGIAFGLHGIAIVKSHTNNIFDEMSTSDLTADWMPTGLDILALEDLQSNVSLATTSVCLLDTHTAGHLSYSIKAFIKDLSSSGTVYKNIVLGIDIINDILASLDRLNHSCISAYDIISGATKKLDADIITARRVEAGQAGSEEDARVLLKSPSLTEPVAKKEIYNKRTLLRKSCMDWGKTLRKLRNIITAEHRRFKALKEDFDHIATAVPGGHHTGSQNNSAPSLSLMDAKLVETAFLNIVRAANSSDSEPQMFIDYYEHLCDGEQAYFCGAAAWER